MDNNKTGVWKRFWRYLKRPHAKYSLLTLVAVGFFSSIIFWSGLSAGIDATNTLEFCISCHEMRDNVYQEYKETIHYSNRSGVRASCSDCHVPRDWRHKIMRKIQASHEVWGKLTGVIDTPEKFEARRMEMASKEWKRKKSRDTHECRNCHSFTAMEVKKQRPSAQKKHAEAQEQGGTCIDCHKGIAHLLPAEYIDPNEDEDEE